MVFQKGIHPITEWKKGHISWNKGLNIPNNRVFYDLRRKILCPSAKILTPELAYIVGALKGDGSLVFYMNSSFRLKLAVNDLGFAQKFKEFGEKQFGLNGSYKIVQDRWHKNPRHQVCFYSKDLRFLKDFNLDLILTNDEFKKEFINGFFDSEGWVVFKSRLYQFQVWSCNTKKELLEFCQKILSSFEIKSKLYLFHSEKLKKNPLYRLCILGKKNIFLFYKNFSFTIPRKQDKLESIINHWSIDNEKNNMDNPINDIGISSNG
jgi:intein-encoded DNA endonuclease-like protein